MRKIAIMVLLFVSFLLVNICMARVVTRTWTAPADDEGTSTERRVDRYELRYSSSPIINKDDFQNAILLPTDMPKEPGQNEVYSYDLDIGNTYLYFRLISFDVAGNESELSNEVVKDFFRPSQTIDLQ